MRGFEDACGLVFGEVVDLVSLGSQAQREVTGLEAIVVLDCVAFFIEDAQSSSTDDIASEEVEVTQCSERLFVGDAGLELPQPDEVEGLLIRGGERDLYGISIALISIE